MVENRHLFNEGEVGKIRYLVIPQWQTTTLAVVVLRTPDLFGAGAGLSSSSFEVYHVILSMGQLESIINSARPLSSDWKFPIMPSKMYMHEEIAHPDSLQLRQHEPGQYFLFLNVIIMIIIKSEILYWNYVA